MRRHQMHAAMLLVIGGFLGCNKVVKNTSDKTPPQVEIKVKGSDGQYVAASTAKLSASAGGQLEWMCIVSDANGVMSTSISYASSLDGCTIQSAVWDSVARSVRLPSSPCSSSAGPGTDAMVDLDSLRGVLARLLGWANEGVVEHALRSIELAAAHRAHLVLRGMGDLMPVRPASPDAGRGRAVRGV